MNKILSAFLLFPGIVLVLVCGEAAWAIGGNMGNGLGTADSPYLIEDFADFQTFAAHAATYWAAGVHSRLETDLDLDPALPGRQIYTSAAIAPDTDPADWGFQGPRFAGVFDGNYFRLRHFTIDTNGAEKWFLGFFGFVDFGGQLNHVIMENTQIISASTCSFIGSLCGENSGAITSCAMLNSTIDINNATSIGGLCGRNSGSIIDSYATGTVLSGNDSRYLGGLCGTNNTNSLIATSYTTSALLGGENNLYMGGLCGANAGTINNCYATGAAVGQTGSSFIGGLCGWDYYGIISKCYAVGAPGGDNYIGGLCGYRTGSSSLITACFWDVETSGIPDPEAGQPDTDGMIGKTTADMQALITFTAANWDFTTSDGNPAIWTIRETITYPLLAWNEYLPGDFSGDSFVNLADFAIFAAAWLTNDGDPGYNPACNLDTTAPSDNTIDIADWIIFCQYWLEEEN